MGKVLELFQLDDHIKQCEDRFNTLLDQIDQVDRRLDRLEDLVLEIKQIITRV
jgi:hypothetical protein